MLHAAPCDGEPALLRVTHTHIAPAAPAPAPAAAFAWSPSTHTTASPHPSRAPCVLAGYPGCRRPTSWTSGRAPAPSAASPAQRVSAGAAARAPAPPARAAQGRRRRDLRADPSLRPGADGLGGVPDAVGPALCGCGGGAPADLQMVNMSLRILSKPSEEQLANIFKVRCLGGGAPERAGAAAAAVGSSMLCARVCCALPSGGDDGNTGGGSAAAHTRPAAARLRAFAVAGPGLGGACAAVHRQRSGQERRGAVQRRAAAHAA